MSNIAIKSEPKSDFVAEGRRGIIYVERELLDHQTLALLDFFARWQILVVRAEMHFARDSLEYTVFSPRLPRIERGVQTPTYEIERQGDGLGLALP